MADSKKKGVRFSKYETDATLEDEGVWETYEGAFRVKIGRINNSGFQEFFMKSENQTGQETEDEDVKIDVMKRAVAETILLDWEGMLDDKDKLIPYSPKEALKRLTSSSEFYNRIVVLANQRARFRHEVIEGAEKNS